MANFNGDRVLCVSYFLKTKNNFMKKKMAIIAAVIMLSCVASQSKANVFQSFWAWLTDTTTQISRGGINGHI